MGTFRQTFDLIKNAAVGVGWYLSTSLQYILLADAAEGINIFISYSNIRNVLGLLVLPKGTSSYGQEDPGIKPTLLLMAFPLYHHCYSRQKRLCTFRSEDRFWVATYMVNTEKKEHSQ